MPGVGLLRRMYPRNSLVGGRLRSHRNTMPLFAVGPC
jgi:hypothetical protein